MIQKRLAAAALLMTTLCATVIVRAEEPAPNYSKQGERGAKVPAFWVRPGYKVTLAAEIPSARDLEVDANGTLYVTDMGGRGQSDMGKQIFALRDEDHDGVYESKTVFLKNYPRANGFCLADDGYLYFTTSGAIYRVKPGDGKSEGTGVETVIKPDVLPKDGGHWWRPVLVRGGYLWTSIGDPGNLTDQTETDRCKIWRFKTDGTDKTLWCSGIRNTEKLRFRPGTSEIYGCDHGSDNLGKDYGETNGGPITDKYPPEEFNHYIQGFNYGHPFVTGLGLPRPEYAKLPDILKKVDENTPPVWMFGAHNAACGWTFTAQPKLTGQVGDAIVALHGSWNSRAKVGYSVTRVIFDDATGKPCGEQSLVGTLGGPNKTEVLARPVDVVELADGAILFSDDLGGKIYRVQKTGK